MWSGDDSAEKDDEYFGLFSQALAVCGSYRPKFGMKQPGGLALRDFERLYRADPFYSWMGLDSPLVYAAHRAAGGMTSMYRQIGIAGQWLFQRVVEDCLDLDHTEATWSYEVPTPTGGSRKLALDARIELSAVSNTDSARRVRCWIESASTRLLLPEGPSSVARGAVFEVRQGYKSMDSKRQNADISNAASAYAARYLPVILLLSTQIDSGLIARYTAARWLLLAGYEEGGATDSTYAFAREVLGYDLAGFFKRNSGRLRAEINRVLEKLLEPSSA